MDPENKFLQQEAIMIAAQFIWVGDSSKQKTSLPPPIHTHTKILL